MSAKSRTSDDQPRYWAVVPAAGCGSRMGTDTPKQYLPLAGQSVIGHSLGTLFSVDRIAGIVVAVATEDNRWPAVRARFADRNLVTVAGGRERCHSVLNAARQLAARAGSGDWVLVHDAARPCVRKADIDRLIDALAGERDGGLLGVPVADTMKRAGADARITETVDRHGLWHAQTPQLFRLGLLQAALEQAIGRGVMVTDEAAAMELAGYRPRLVEGHRDNIKITTPADLALAEFHLNAGRPR